jgi:arylsulfatase A-like enzyme
LVFRRAFCAAAFVVLSAGVAPLGPATAQASNLPNIVVIMTDDQRWNLLGDMPNVQAKLLNKGMQFRQTIVSNPLCCPSRAAFFTGTYSHTNGVWTNGLPDRTLGGWHAFIAHESNTLATWLNQSGYRTALAGKYLNGYDDPTHIPPGWDRWAAFIGDGGVYYDYDLVVDLDGDHVAESQHYGMAPFDYSTDVLTNISMQVIADTPAEKPLFLYFAPTAAHAPFTPAPRHVDAVVDPHFPHNRAMNEADVSDKPLWVRDLPLLTSEHLDKQHKKAEKQARALIAVDDGLGEIVDAMKAAGRTDTIYILIGDQGVDWGEHRWTYKLDPYEMTVRQPMIIRWAGHVSRGVTDALVQNVDVAPTLAEIVGTQAPGAEGVSLTPLFDGKGAVRTKTFTEHLWFERAGKPNPPTYCEIRNLHWKYIRYDTGEEEMYRLAKDPQELNGRESRFPKALERFRRIADINCTWMD